MRLRVGGIIRRGTDERWGSRTSRSRSRTPRPSRRSRRKMLVATRRGSSVLDRRARVSSHRDGRAGLRAADVPCGSVGRGVRMACAAARRISRARRTPLVDPRGTSHACPGARRARDGHARRGACDRAWCRAVHDRSRFLTLRGVADDEPARRDVIASRAPVHAQKEGIPEPARTEKLAATSAALYKERSGEGGIRTPGGRSLTRFRVVPFQPGSRTSPWCRRRADECVLLPWMRIDAKSARSPRRDETFAGVERCSRSSATRGGATAVAERLRFRP